MLQDKTYLQTTSIAGFRQFLISLDGEHLAKPAARIDVLVKNEEKEDVVSNILRKCQAKCLQDQAYSSLHHFVTRLNLKTKQTIYVALGGKECCEGALYKERLLIAILSQLAEVSLHSQFQQQAV